MLSLRLQPSGRHSPCHLCGDPTNSTWVPEVARVDQAHSEVVPGEAHLGFWNARFSVHLFHSYSQLLFNMRIEDATVIASPIVVSHSRSGSTSSYDSTRALASLEGIAPSRPPTTTATSEERIPIEGLADIRLKVDAGPGCGGVSWPSGEVSTATT